MIYLRWFVSLPFFTLLFSGNFCCFAQQKTISSVHYQINAEIDTTKHRINGQMTIVIKTDSNTPDSLFLACLPNLNIPSSKFSALKKGQINNDQDLALFRKQFADSRRLQGLEIDNITTEPQVIIGEQDDEGTFLYLTGIKSLKTDSLKINLQFRYYYPENKITKLYGSVRASRWYPVLLFTNPNKILFPFQSNSVFPVSYCELTLKIPEGYFYTGSNRGSAIFQNTIHSSWTGIGTFDFFVSNNMLIDEYKISNSKGLIIYPKKYISKIKNIKDIVTEYLCKIEQKTGLHPHINPIIIGPFSEEIGKPESGYIFIDPEQQSRNNKYIENLLIYKLITQSLQYHEQNGLDDTEFNLLSDLLYVIVTGTAQRNSIPGHRMQLLPLKEDSMRTRQALEICLKNHSGFSGFLNAFASIVSENTSLYQSRFYQQTESIDFSMIKQEKRLIIKTGKNVNIPLKYRILLKKTVKDSLLVNCPDGYEIKDTGFIKRIIVNPDMMYHEQNYGNNTKGKGKIRFLPYSLKKSDPYRRELRAFVFPSWNQASMAMVSMLLDWNNQSIQRFGATFIPSYSFKYHYLGGLGILHTDIFRNSKDTLRCNISGQRFLTGHLNGTINGFEMSEDFDYLRLSYAFRWIQNNGFSLEFKHHYLEVSHLLYYAEGNTYIPQKATSPQHFFNLTAQYHTEDIINPFRAQITVCGNSNFAKIETGLTYRSYYDSKNFVQISYRGAWFPAVKDEYKSRYDLRLRFSDPLPGQDIFYENLVFDRQAGSDDFLFCQTYHQPGSFYSWSPYGQSWKYLANLHFEFSVPIPIPLVFFGGIGISGNDAVSGEKMNIAGESGAYVHFIGEKVKVIFPLLTSAKYKEATNLNLDKYEQKIRVSLEFTSDDIRKVFRF